MSFWKKIIICPSRVSKEYVNGLINKTTRSNLTLNLPVGRYGARLVKKWNGIKMLKSFLIANLAGVLNLLSLIKIISLSRS